MLWRFELQLEQCLAIRFTGFYFCRLSLPLLCTSRMSSWSTVTNYWTSPLPRNTKTPFIATPLRMTLISWHAARTFIKRIFNSVLEKPVKMAPTLKFCQNVSLWESNKVLSRRGSLWLTIPKYQLPTKKTLCLGNVEAGTLYSSTVTCFRL